MPRFVIVFALLLWGAGAQANVPLGVNSPSVRFSPGNWAGDAGRGGGLHRRTWNNGAWCAWRWSTPSDKPAATLQISNPTPGSAVSYFLDGALVNNVPVPAQGGIALVGLASRGSHTLVVYTRNSPQRDRWNGANAFTVSGLSVDDGARALPASPARPWVLMIGDSITEGIQADNGRDSALSDYAFLVGQGLVAAGYDYGVSACGYSGWIRPGDAGGDVPAFYAVRDGIYAGTASRWDKIDARTSLLDTRGHLSGWGRVGQEPAAILVNYATNEVLSGASLADMRVSVAHCLAALRSAAPKAQLLILVPPGLYSTRIYSTGPVAVRALKDGVAAYRAAHLSDKRVSVIDLGPSVANALASPVYGGGVHPNAAGHAFLAPCVLQAVLSLLERSRPGG